MRAGALFFVAIALLGCEGNHNRPSIENPDHRLALLLASIDVPSNCVLSDGSCTLEKSLLGAEIDIKDYSHVNTYPIEGTHNSEKEWRSRVTYSYSFASPTDGIEIVGSIDWNAQNYLNQNQGYTVLSQGCYGRNYSRTESSDSSVLVALKRSGQQKYFTGTIKKDSVYPHKQSFCQIFPASQFPESDGTIGSKYPRSDCFLSTKKCWSQILGRNQQERFGLYYWNRSPAFFYGNLPPLFLEVLYPNDTYDTYPRLEFHTGNRSVIFESEDSTHGAIEINYEASIHPSSDKNFSKETVHELFNRQVSYKTDITNQSMTLIGNDQTLISVYNNEVERQQFPYQSLHSNDAYKVKRTLTSSQAVNTDMTGSTLLDYSVETVIDNLPKLNFIDPGEFHRSGTTQEIDTISVCQAKPCPLSDYIAVQVDTSGLESNFSDWDSLLKTTYTYEEMVTELHAYDSEPERFHFDGVIEFLDIEGNKLLLDIDTEANTGAFELINSGSEIVDFGSLYISIGDSGVICESGLRKSNEYRYNSPGPRHACNHYYRFTRMTKSF